MHSQDKIHCIHGALNNVITVEQLGQQYVVYFYAAAAEEEKIRIVWNLDSISNTNVSMHANVNANINSSAVNNTALSSSNVNVK